MTINSVRIARSGLSAFLFILSLVAGSELASAQCNGSSATGAYSSSVAGAGCAQACGVTTSYCYTVYCNVYTNCSSGTFVQQSVATQCAVLGTISYIAPCYCS